MLVLPIVTAVLAEYQKHFVFVNGPLHVSRLDRDIAGQTMAT